MTNTERTIETHTAAAHASLVYPKYRPDVDGLRAIAVLLVVVFHAFPEALPGGFVGVDVFFVISGYLISSIIFSSVERGTFSFAEFYARRIKRIFPALIAVLASLYAVGWFTLFADEFKQLGKHILAGAGFVSNLVLWSEAGYFDTSAETKPLLHLWSLGIEEQFYIIYPLLIVVVHRMGVRIPVFLGLLGGASFLWNVATVAPGSVAAFYSPLTRFWELLLGASLAYRALHARTVSDGGRGFAALVGLALICSGAAILNQTSAFPGWNALLPTVGTALVVWSSPRASFNRVLFGNRALVAIGLISYPVYLWHWPLLSMGRILGHTAFTERLACVAASFVLATFTYQCIEKPIRFRLKGRGVVWVLSVLMSMLAALGFVTLREGGFRERAANSQLGQNAQELEGNPSQFFPAVCPKDVNNDALQLMYCKVSKESQPTYALFGDSHADDKFYGFATGDPSNSWLLIGSNSCAPVKGITVISDHPGCRAKSEGVIDYLVHAPAIHTVVISFYGAYMLETAFAADHVTSNKGPGATRIESAEFPGKSKPELFEIGLDNAVAALEGAGKEVVILLDVPELPFFPRDCLRQQGSCTLATSTVLERQAVMRQIVDRIQARHPKVRVYDTLGLFCGAETCRFEIDGRIIYRDSHHLSEWGSAYVARNFFEWLKRHS